MDAPSSSAKRSVVSTLIPPASGLRVCDSAPLLAQMIPGSQTRIASGICGAARTNRPGRTSAFGAGGGAGELDLGGVDVAFGDRGFAVAGSRPGPAVNEDRVPAAAPPLHSIDGGVAIGCDWWLGFVSASSYLGNR